MRLCTGRECRFTKRNLYAVLLVAVLLAIVVGSGRIVSDNIGKTEEELHQAYGLALSGQFEAAAQGYRTAAENSCNRSRILCLFVRRSLLDKVNETLATLEHYALPDNPADLAVETARAFSQLEQLEESFIAVF